MGMGSLIFIAVLAIAVFMVITIYNKLVTLKNRYINGFAQIEVQLKRRYDLIPNLVETAKAYLEHERETLEAVVSARNQASSSLQAAAANPGDATALGSLGSAEQALGSALGRMNVLVEAYPELKANENMQQLSEELVSTENRVAFARQGYNDQVTEYNIYRQTFPPVFVAPLFGHGKNAAMLDYEDREAMQDAPSVKF